MTATPSPQPLAATALALPRPFLPLPVWLPGLGLCLALGVGEGLMVLLGGLIRPGTTLELPLAGAQWAGTTGLRSATAALMLLLAVLAQRWLGQPWRYGAALLLAVALGTVASWALYEASFCPTAQVLGYAQRYPVCIGQAPVHDWTWVFLARHGQMALLVTGLVSYLALSRHATRALQRAQLQQLALEREQAASQAQLLQSQIEPHFLFNTLANLRRLLQTDAAAGLAMVADLRRYLQQALPRLRGTSATLADEVALVRAYLELHAVRMGARLQYTIDLPEALHRAPLPPMLLLTLVENALKHGLQPLPEGGRIEIDAQATPAGLQLRVRDTGRGMGQAIGHGMGLANLRGRLRALYGAQASLSLRLAEPSGLCAVLTLPESAA